MPRIWPRGQVEAGTAGRRAHGETEAAEQHQAEISSPEEARVRTTMARLLPSDDRAARRGGHQQRRQRLVLLLADRDVERPVGVADQQDHHQVRHQRAGHDAASGCRWRCRPARPSTAPAPPGSGRGDRAPPRTPAAAHRRAGRADRAPRRRGAGGCRRPGCAPSCPRARRSDSCPAASASVRSRWTTHPGSAASNASTSGIGCSTSTSTACSSLPRSRSMLLTKPIRAGITTSEDSTTATIRRRSRTITRSSLRNIRKVAYMVPGSRGRSG